MQHFSDFSSEDKPLEGDKVNIEDLIGVKIEVHGFNVKNSKFNENKCMTVQIIHNEDKRVFFTGSDVLIKQCEKYKNNMPFITTLKKINRYYTFS